MSEDGAGSRAMHTSRSPWFDDSSVTLDPNAKTSYARGSTVVDASRTRHRELGHAMTAGGWARTGARTPGVDHQELAQAFHELLADLLAGHADAVGAVPMPHVRIPARGALRRPAAVEVGRQRRQDRRHLIRVETREPVAGVVVQRGRARKRLVHRRQSVGVTGGHGGEAMGKGPAKGARERLGAEGRTGWWSGNTFAQTGRA